MSAPRRAQRNGPPARPASMEDRSGRGAASPAYPARRTGRPPRACSRTSRRQHASACEARTRFSARPCILRDQSQPDSIFASSHAFPAPDDVTLVVEGPDRRAARQQSAGVVQPLLDCRHYLFAGRRLSASQSCPRAFLRGRRRRPRPPAASDRRHAGHIVGVNGVPPLRVEITTLRISLSLASRPRPRTVKRSPFDASW